MFIAKKRTKSAFCRVNIYSGNNHKKRMAIKTKTIFFKVTSEFLLNYQPVFKWTTFWTKVISDMWPLSVNYSLVQNNNDAATPELCLERPMIA